MADVQSWVYAHERAYPGDIGHKVGNVVMELLALREVAAAARALELAMADVPCECADRSCEALCKALRLAGL